MIQMIMFLYFLKDINTNFLIFQAICHQNSLIKRSLFFEHEFYKEK